VTLKRSWFADINLEKIEAFIKELCDKRLKGAKINAENVTEMADLMTGCDVVASGPILKMWAYRFPSERR